MLLPNRNEREERVSFVDEVLELAEALGLDTLAEARVLAARGEALRVELADQRKAVERSRARIVSDLAAGVDVAASSLSKVAVESLVWELDGPAASMRAHAAAACSSSATEKALQLTPQLFNALIDLIADAVARSVKAASELPPAVVDDAAAVSAGPDVVATWAELGVQLQRWVSAHDLAAKLRGANWFERYELSSDARRADEPGDRQELFVRYLNPERLPPGYWRLHPRLRLAAAAAADAGPGLYTASDAAQRWRVATVAAAQAERAAWLAKQRRQPVQVLQ